MLTLLRVPRLNKNSKNSNGQELEKTLEESKEMDIKRKENKTSGMDFQFWIFQGGSYNKANVPLWLKFWPVSSWVISYPSDCLVT